MGDEMNIEAKHHYRFDYLQSDHWKNLRLEKLASRNATCIRCGKQDPSNDVHHFIYRNLYDVELEDLAVLCRDCHDLVHTTVDAALAAKESGEKLRDCFLQFLSLWPRKKDPEIQRAIEHFRVKLWDSPRSRDTKVPTPKKPKTQNEPPVVFSITLSREEYDALFLFSHANDMDVNQCVRRAIGRLAQDVKKFGAVGTLLK